LPAFDFNQDLEPAIESSHSLRSLRCQRFESVANLFRCTGNHDERVRFDLYGSSTAARYDKGIMKVRDRGCLSP